MAIVRSPAVRLSVGVTASKLPDTTEAAEVALLVGGILTSGLSIGRTGFLTRMALFPVGVPSVC